MSDAPSTASAPDERVVALLERIANGIDGLRAAAESSAAASASPLLTRDEFAALLKVDHRTLRRLELLGEIPHAITIGTCKRWKRSAIERWLAKRSAA